MFLTLHSRRSQSNAIERRLAIELGSVNYLPEEAQNENGETNLFADDSTTFEIGNTVDDAISKIKKTAKHIESYSNNNSLTER